MSSGSVLVAAPETYKVSKGIFEDAVVTHAGAYGALLLNDLPAVLLSPFKVAVDIINLEDSSRTAMLHLLH